MADIPINEVTRRVQFTGNTTTGPFAFTFNILSDDDIIVYKNFVLQTITTDYTVSTNANGTGSITLTSALVASDVLTIIGGRALERTTDFVTAGDLLASSLNEQLDSQVIMTQQLDEKLDRSLKVDIGDQFTDLSLPSKANRLGAVLAFNATSGDPEAGPQIADVSSLAAITADIATLADIEDGTDATDAIQTVAGISSNVSTVAGISGNVTTVAGISSNVTTVAGISANTTTVAGISSDVTTVAGISSNVSTVAGISSNVTTVAGDSADIQALAAKTTEIGLLGTADAIADMNTLATSAIVTDMDALANLTSEIDALGDVTSDITTVSGISANVTTVAGISANVTTVAGDTANIGTIATDLNGSDTIGSVATNISNVNSVAGNASNINSVAGNSTNINAVAGNATNINAVAADTTDIGTVATDIANVNTVAGNNTNINTVAGISSNVTTVAGISSNVTTVAGISSDVTAVANDSSDIGTVASGITNINTVAGSITNVNTVATNISGVNSFAERYRVGSSDPTTSLDAGDLAFNTTDNGFKFYDGSSWQTVNVSGIGSLAEDTTPQLGGNLDLNSSDITGTGDVNITGTITASSTVSGSNIPAFLPDNFVTATANGAISDGDVVFQNTDGTVEKFTAASVTGESLGSAVTIDEYSARSCAFDSANNKIVMAYKDASTGYPVCKIGTISGTSVSFGSAVTISTNQVYASAGPFVEFDTNSNKAVIIWADNDDNRDLKAVVGTVSGTSISFGSIATAATGGTNVTKWPLDTTFDSYNNKIVLIYYDGNNSNYGTSVIGTVSGTSISFGTPVVFNSATTFEQTCTFDSFNNKVIVAYKDNGGTTDGEAVVGTVSGTSISYGSLVTFADYSGTPSQNIFQLKSIFDSSQNKVVIFYRGGNTGAYFGYGIVGTVSGTSISFGTPSAYRGSETFALFNGQATYDSTAEAAILVFRNTQTGAEYSRFVVGKVSGTSITFRSSVLIDSGATGGIQLAAYDSSNNKTFIAHSRTGTTDQAFVLTLTLAPATDLDTYIGISNGAYSDTATATIQIVGSVDDAQSGLTIGTSYFVADDGSLSATNNGRKIGKAVSATELIIDTAMTGSEMNAYLGGLV